MATGTVNRIAARMNGNGQRPRWVSTNGTRSSRPQPARPTSASGRPRPSVATLVDRAIAWIAPGWAQKRIEARLKARALIDYYDGATIGRRGASIRRSIADANSISEVTLPRLRAGSRDLVRNNPLAARAVNLIAADVVGMGIQPQFLRDGSRAEEIEEIAARCLESTACDADGRATYGGIQRLATRTWQESGEVLVRRRVRRLSDRLPDGRPLEVPVQFQVIEPDFLDERRDVQRLPNGGRIVQGIEFDAIGRRRGYWLFREHPGARRLTSMESSFVPASEVLHVYETDRPGQVRGIPRLAPVMLRIADLADYEEAQLVRQKIAACLVGFIEEPFSFRGAPPNAEKDGDDFVQTFEPGTWSRGAPGETVTFSDPPQVQGYEEYIRVSDHRIAAALGVSYEALTGDLKSVNFSSARMGWLQYQRNISTWQRLILIPQLCDPMARWFLEGLTLAGVDTEGVTVRHVPPRREMIDPTKEIPAEKIAIRAGLKTLTQSITESGRDPREHLEELAADMAMLDELGLKVETDVRQSTATATQSESFLADSDESSEEEAEEVDEGVDSTV